MSSGSAPTHNTHGRHPTATSEGHGAPVGQHWTTLTGGVAGSSTYASFVGTCVEDGSACSAGTATLQHTGEGINAERASTHHACTLVGYPTRVGLQLAMQPAGHILMKFQGCIHCLCICCTVQQHLQHFNGPDIMGGIILVVMYNNLPSMQGLSARFAQILGR